MQVTQYVLAQITMDYPVLSSSRLFCSAAELLVRVQVQDKTMWP